jgi:hypothetical protein
MDTTTNCLDKCDDRIADTIYNHQDDCLVLAVVLASAIIKEEMSFGSGLQFFRSKCGKFLIPVEIFLDIAYNGRPQEHPGMIRVWILQLSVSGEL